MYPQSPSNEKKTDDLSAVETDDILVITVQNDLIAKNVDAGNNGNIISTAPTQNIMVTAYFQFSFIYSFFS